MRIIKKSQNFSITITGFFKPERKIIFDVLFLQTETDS